MVEDGNNYNGYVAANPGVYPALFFSYRGITAREKSKQDGKRKALEMDFTMAPDRRGEQAEIIRARAVADHVSAWDYANASGEPRPVTVDVLLDEIPLSLYNRLYGIITNFQGCDPLPDGTLIEEYNEVEQVKN